MNYLNPKRVFYNEFLSLYFPYRNFINKFINKNDYFK
jgi:hypothetical protein